MALISTLTDNFDDNSLDGAKWTDGGGTAETNQQLEITTTTAANNVRGIYSNSLYDATGSSMSIKVVDAGNQDLVTYRCYPCWLYISGLENIFLYINQNTIYAAYGNYGSGTTVASTAYVAASHKYFRIREASGTTYWDYSADGISWSNLGSVANPYTMTNFEVDIGTFTNSELSTTVAKFDDFNILPSASTNVSFTNLPLLGVG